MSETIARDEGTALTFARSRPLRFFGVDRSGGAGSEPWLVIGEPSRPPRRRPRRQRLSLVESGFGVLDVGQLIFPVAPRWRIRVEGGSLRVLVAGEPLVEIDDTLVPPQWRASLDSEGMAWVVSGAALNMAGADVLDILRPAIDVGLAFGGLVLLD